MSETTEKTIVYIISDSVGETAEFVVKAAASQYESGSMELRRFPCQRSGRDNRDFEGCGKQHRGLSLVLPELRRAVEREAARFGVATADIMAHHGALAA